LQSKLRGLTDRVRRAWYAATDPSPRILCADDDESVRVLCSAALRRAGYEVDIARDGREAVECIRRRRYSAILLDLAMPYLHGATVLAIIKKTQPEALSTLIVITGASDLALGEIVGPRMVIKKPFGVGRLIDAVNECCGTKALSGTKTRIAP
jgi:DNA-binding NtrC family response regulator